MAGWFTGLVVGSTAFSGLDPDTVGGPAAKFIIQVIAAFVCGWVLGWIGTIVGAIIQGMTESFDDWRRERTYGKRSPRPFSYTSDKDKEAAIDSLATRIQQRKLADALGVPTTVVDEREAEAARAAEAKDEQDYWDRVRKAGEEPPIPWVN